MRNRTALQRVLGFLIGGLLGFLLTFGVMHFDPKAIFPLLLAFAALSFLFVIALIPIGMKANLLKSTAPQEPRVAQLDDFPRLPRAEWDALQTELLALGFEPRVVWVLGEANPRLGINVWLNFEHPQHAALATISQALLPKRLTPIDISVFSYWDNAAQRQQLPSLLALTAPISSPFSTPAEAKSNEMEKIENELRSSYTTSNQAGSWIFNLLEHPKIMNVRMPGASPTQLLATHLSQRDLMSGALGQAPQRDNLVATTNFQVQCLFRLWNRRVRTTPFLPSLWRAMRRGTPKREYFGALESEITALKSKTDA